MADTPDPGTDPEFTHLEGEHGVEPGATPPDAAQTSGLSEPEPRTSRRFPPTGIATLIVVGILVLIFAVVAVGLILLVISR